MDWNRVEGNWKQFTGKVKEKWGKLTDDDLTTIAGKRDQLAGNAEDKTPGERYGDCDNGIEPQQTGQPHPRIEMKEQPMQRVDAGAHGGHGQAGNRPN